MNKSIVIFILLLFGKYCFGQKNNTAEEYIKNYQYNEALEYINNQEEITPYLLFQKALCYKALDNYHDAIDILHTLTNDEPDNIKLNAELATCYVAISNWSKSAHHYYILTQLDTVNTFFKTQYANMLLKNGNYSKALTIYDNIHRKYNFNSVLRYKAECYENMNMNDSALAYYEKAWKYNESDAYSLANLLSLKIKKGELAEAASISDIYIEKNSTNRVINRLNALAYYSTNLFYNESVERFERCFQTGDSTLMVRKGLGMSYYALLNAEKAYPHLIQTYLADTGNVNIIYPLAEVCMDLKKYDEAVKYYNKFVEKIIPDPKVVTIGYKRLATAYEKNEQYGDALTWYRKLVNRIDYDQKMELYYKIGNICDEKTKEYNDAVFYYEGYKKYLTAYIKQKEAELDKERNSTAEKEIEETRGKLTSLDKRIIELQELLNQRMSDELADDSLIYTNEAIEWRNKNKINLATNDSISDKKTDH